MEAGQVSASFGCAGTFCSLFCGAWKLPGTLLPSWNPWSRLYSPLHCLSYQPMPACVEVRLCNWCGKMETWFHIQECIVCSLRREKKRGAFGWMNIWRGIQVQLSISLVGLQALISIATFRWLCKAVGRYLSTHGCCFVQGLLLYFFFEELAIQLHCFSKLSAYKSLHCLEIKVSIHCLAGHITRAFLQNHSSYERPVLHFQVVYANSAFDAPNNRLMLT